MIFIYDDRQVKIDYDDIRIYNLSTNEKEFGLEINRDINPDSADILITNGVPKTIVYDSPRPIWFPIVEGELKEECWNLYVTDAGDIVIEYGECIAVGSDYHTVGEVLGA